jgi:hypothetical protein
MILPFTPNHDGVRLFLPVFPFIAYFAGIGFNKTETWLHSNIILKNKIKVSLQLSYSGLGTIVLLPLLINLAGIYPYYLEWYNGLNGGVSGTHKAGFETTYWLRCTQRFKLANR